MACTKVWDAALTQAELELEMARMLPVRYANLHAWYPMFPGATERLVDYFSAGKTLTAGGTLTDEAGPPIGWGFAPQRVSFSTTAAVATRKFQRASVLGV
jgi:hypothetical protein